MKPHSHLGGPTYVIYQNDIWELVARLGNLARIRYVDTPAVSRDKWVWYDEVKSKPPHK